MILHLIIKTDAKEQIFKDYKVDSTPELFILSELVFESESLL